IPWIWSVLRASPSPDTRVRYRAGAMSPALIDHIVDDAIDGGSGADLEVTFWNAPDHVVETTSRVLTALRGTGVAVHVFRGIEGDGRCNDGCGRDVVAAEDGAAGLGHVHGFRWTHPTTGGESDHASKERQRG